MRSEKEQINKSLQGKGLPMELVRERGKKEIKVHRWNYYMG